MHLCLMHIDTSRTYILLAQEAHTRFLLVYLLCPWAVSCSSHCFSHLVLFHFPDHVL